MALGFLTAPAAAHAIEIKVSAQALERTLNTQLFNGADGRYYFRGTATSPCYAYAQEPKVSFKDERIVIHVKTHARLGEKVGGACLGVGLNTEADVSVIPDAQGESIGFRDPNLDHLSTSQGVELFPDSLPQQEAAAADADQCGGSDSAATGEVGRGDGL